MHHAMVLSGTLIRELWFSNPLGSRKTQHLWRVLFFTLPVIHEYLQFNADLIITLSANSVNLNPVLLT